jgi:hypothetical protein
LSDRSRADFGGETVDDGGLADSGFARQPHELALAGLRALPTRVQARERALSTRKFLASLRSGARDDYGRRERFATRCRATDEPITTARNGLDVARLASIVGEGNPNLTNRRFQHRFADETMAPYFVEQRVLVGELARLAREHTQQGERLRWERDRRAGARQ